MYDYEAEAGRVTSGEITRAQFVRRGLAAGVSVSFLAQALAACGGGDATSTSGQTGGPASSGAPATRAIAKTPTAPFDPNVKPGLKPDLPRRIGLPMPNDSELITTTITDAVRAGTETAGFELITAQSNGDSPKQFEQAQSMLSRGLAAFVIFDAAPPALAPVQLRAIEQGAAVFCGPFATSTCQLTADQYKIGNIAGTSAVRWIADNLGGNAEVAIFNYDIAPSQRPKFQGVRDALRSAGSGIKVVTELTCRKVTTEEGFAYTNTVLQKHPNVKVWISGDGPLGGTLAALEAAGKAGDDVALFSIGDGDPQAQASILKGGPFKSTVAFSYATSMYAFGRYMADWVEGKSIPMVVSIEGLELTDKESIDTFKSINEDPARAFEENSRNLKYFTPLGNTSYEDHRYLTTVAEVG